MKKLLTIIALFFLSGCGSQKVTLQQKQAWVDDFIKQADHLQDQSITITTTSSSNGQKQTIEDYYYVEDTRDYLQVVKSQDENQDITSLKLMITDHHQINMYQGFTGLKLEQFNSIEATNNYLTCHEFNLEDVVIDYEACTRKDDTITIYYSKTQDNPINEGKTMTNYFTIEATCKNNQLTSVTTKYYLNSRDNDPITVEKTINYQVPDYDTLKQKLNSCIDQNVTDAIKILES